MIATLLDRVLLFLYVVTTAPVFLSFLVFLAFVQHSRVVSLSDGVRGRGVYSGGVDGMDISVF